MKRTQSTAADLIGGTIGHLIAWAFAVWLAMLLIGAAHSTDQRIPALGFFTVAFLGVAVSALGAVASSGVTRAKS